MFEPRFVHGDRFCFRDNEYYIRKTLENGDVEVENLSYGKRIEVYYVTELERAFDNEQLIFRGNDTDVQPFRYYHHSAYPEEHLEVIEKRYKIIQPIIDGKVQPSEYKSYLDSIPEEDRAINSVTSLYRWLGLYRKSGKDKRSLANDDYLKGPNARTTNSEIIGMITGLVEPKCKKGLDVVKRIIKAELSSMIDRANMDPFRKEKLELPSRPTIDRIINDCVDKFAKDRERVGLIQAELNVNGSTSELEVKRPLQRVELDWTPIDLLVVDAMTLKRKRFVLIFMVDKFTGYPVGFYISDKEPGVTEVMQCLLHGMLPKSYMKILYPKVQHEWIAYGKPEVLVVDNARVNDAKLLKGMLSLFGIDVLHAPVRAAHYKGTIERMFRTINTKIIHSLEGTTFSNPQIRQLYESEKKACVTLKELNEIIHITLVDLIANDYRIPNSSTPHAAWELAMAEQKVHRTLPRSKMEAIITFAGGETTRLLTREGVELFGQHYKSPELTALFEKLSRKRKDRLVSIRYDLADMRTVYVVDEDEHNYIKARPIRNSLKNKGLDENAPVHFLQLSQHEYLKNKGYEDFDLTDIGYSYEAIQKIVEEGKKNIQQLERLSPEERASIHYENISAIQATYQSQIQPEALETLEVFMEGQESKESKKAKRSRAKKTSITGTGRKVKTTNESQIEETIEVDQSDIVGDFMYQTNLGGN